MELLHFCKECCSLSKMQSKINFFFDESRICSTSLNGVYVCLPMLKVTRCKARKHVEEFQPYLYMYFFAHKMNKVLLNENENDNNNKSSRSSSNSTNTTSYNNNQKRCEVRTQQLLYKSWNEKSSLCTSEKRINIC